MGIKITELCSEKKEEFYVIPDFDTIQIIKRLKRRMGLQAGQWRRL